MQRLGVQSLNSSFAAQRDFISKFYPFIGNENIEELMNQFETAKRHISRNGNIKIVMTHFALSATKFIKPIKR